MGRTWRNSGILQFSVNQFQRGGVAGGGAEGSPGLRGSGVSLRRSLQLRPADLEIVSADLTGLHGFLDLPKPRAVPWAVLCGPVGAGGRHANRGAAGAGPEGNPGFPSPPALSLRERGSGQRRLDSCRSGGQGGCGLFTRHVFERLRKKGAFEFAERFSTT